MPGEGRFLCNIVLLNLGASEINWHLHASGGWEFFTKQKYFMKIHYIIRVALEQVFDTKSWQLQICPNRYFLSSLLQTRNVIVELNLIDVKIHTIRVMRYLLCLCFV